MDIITSNESNRMICDKAKKNMCVSDRPTLQIAESVVPRKKARISASRRVSFAETYQVK
jgi:hypothetical protein